MTTHTIHRRDDGTIELTATIPWADVSKVYEDVVSETVKQVEMPGFRKGKAPRTLVEEKLDRSKAYEDVIRKLLPEVYNELVTKEKLKPIISPKVELQKAKEKEDWVLIIYTCEKPKITLGDYKKAVHDQKTASHKKIWVPGTDEKKEKQEEKDQKPKIDDILKAVAGAMTVTVSSLLIEQEVNRLLSQLIDQTKTLGLTVEQYLGATGRSSETVRHEYEEQAKRTITLEFGLEEIADSEGIIISDDDIDTVIKTAKTEEEKKSLEKERYYIASVLRRQKTIDFLSNI
jgi:FKBP-type peptidyl-prolyl cis-trans isomerase (trigger factor)